MQVTKWMTKVGKGIEKYKNDRGVGDGDGKGEEFGWRGFWIADR